MTLNFPEIIPILLGSVLIYAALGTLTYHITLPHDPDWGGNWVSVVGGIVWPLGLPIILGIVLVTSSVARVGQWRAARDTRVPTCTVRDHTKTRAK